ncbi:hypothetical protein Tco_0456625 [Tanacetum coccineum]
MNQNWCATNPLHKGFPNTAISNINTPNSEEGGVFSNSKKENFNWKGWGLIRVASQQFLLAEIQAVKGKNDDAKRSGKPLELGYDRFPTVTFSIGSYGADVSTGDAIHIVFEQEIQGAPKPSSSAQNVAFVSQSKSSTNKVKSGFSGAYSSCTPSTSSTNVPEKEVLAGFADEVIYSLFAKQTEDLDLLHEIWNRLMM